MLRIVHPMNPVVGSAGMLRVPHENAPRDFRSLQIRRYIAHTLTRSQQGQGIKKLGLVVLWMSLGQLLHRRGVLRVPFALVGLAAVQDFHRAHISSFARKKSCTAAR